MASVSGTLLVRMSLLHSLACTGEEIVCDVRVDSGVIEIGFVVVCKVMILYMFVKCCKLF